MDSIQVVVKHGPKKYNLELDPSANGETFKYQVFSVSGVEPERQKLISKGKQISDDVELSKLGLKANAQIMLMGTPSGANIVEKPKEQIKFLEDMTEAEAAQTEGAQPAGLQNLGNTCYMNSTLQTLRAIPELQEELQRYKEDPSSSATLSAGGLSQLGLGGLGSATDLTASLRDLYKQMSETQEGVPPLMFLNAFRGAYPQFAERSRDGRGYAQQDAEEAWSQLITTLKQKLKTDSSSSTEEAGSNKPKELFVDSYLGGKVEKIEECLDSEAIEAGETPQKKPGETFYKLPCHISNKEVLHLREGIAAGLVDEYTKTSPTLNREANYKTTSKLSRLPKYLPVHFVRFFWKTGVNKKAKILRKCTFPHELDLTEYCTDELRALLIPVRDKIRELQKEELDVERARKRQKRFNAAVEAENDRQIKGKGPATEADMVAQKSATKVDDAAKKPGANGEGASAATGGSADYDMADAEYKTDAQIEEERAAQILNAKKDLLASVAPELAADRSANKTGLYELRGVVTHQGASADSGHYTAYVKKEGKAFASGEKGPDGRVRREPEDGKWWWFNDDKVSEVEGEKIETLAGGGESHSALILLYRAVELPVLEEGDKAGHTSV